MKLCEHAFRINKVKQEMNEFIKGIKQDGRFSENYKQTLINSTIAEKYMPMIEKYQQEFSDELKQKSEQAKAKEPKFDFNDNRIANAINLLTAEKENTPEEATNAIIESFKGNIPALRVILPYLEKYSLTLPAMDVKEIVSKPTLAERIDGLDDFVYYTSSKADEYFTLERISELQSIDNEIDNLTV